MSYRNSAYSGGYGDEDEVKSTTSMDSAFSVRSTTSSTSSAGRSGLASAVHEWPAEDLLEHLLALPSDDGKPNSVVIPPGAQRIFINLPGPSVSMLSGSGGYAISKLAVDQRPENAPKEDIAWRRSYAHLSSCPVGEHDKVTLEWEPAAWQRTRRKT